MFTGKFIKKAILDLLGLRTIFIEEEDVTGFEEVMSFFKEPSDNSIQKICNNSNCIPFRTDIVNECKKILDIKKNRKNEYRINYYFRQYAIWESFYKCIKKLKNNFLLLTQKDICLFFKDYNKSCEIVIEICNLYADSQYAISCLEDEIGIDRFLDKIIHTDMQKITNKLNQQFLIANKLLKSYKNLFCEKWNLTNIGQLISHKLIDYNQNNYICSNFISNQNNIIFLIIDGFGLTQYLWNKKFNSEKEYISLSTNIFSWLSKEKLIKEKILGSSFITDTGAGIAQIMLGKTGKETGIISSKVETTDNFIQNNKSVNESIFNYEFDIPTNRILQKSKKNNINSTVFYCSKFNSRKESPYTANTFRPSTLKQITPYERVFQESLKDIKNFNTNKNLQISYITAIDHSGHTMGAFSKFEKYEHYKINSLLKNYLIELVLNYPQLFNSKTSIIISADHGMTESSNIMINWKDIQLYFKENNIYSALFLENNRALFIYRINNLKLAKKLLVSFFKKRNIEVDIITKEDENYSHYFYTGSNEATKEIMPQIVIRLTSTGLFYSKPIEEELMHYGGHGGNSICETFVPLLEIELNTNLKEKIEKHFINSLQ